MGGGTEKTTQTTGVQNVDLNSLLSKLSKGISGTYQANGTTYTAPSANTTGSWADTLAAADNPAFAAGINGAIDSYGRRASGAEIGADNPAYAAVRDRIANDVTTRTNEAFNNSGLYASDQNVASLSRGLGDALGSFDYQNLQDDYTRQAQGADMLTKLLSGATLPASIKGSVGAAQDADAAAKANGGLAYQGQYSNLLAQLMGAAPQTTTTTSPTPPLWQTLAGLALAAA
jgi:hypothetical protein